MERREFWSTVGSCLTRVFPKGTQVSSKNDAVYKTAPSTPQDIFAGVGVLLEESGALAFHGAGVNIPHSEYPKLLLDGETTTSMEDVGREWRNSHNKVPMIVQTLWLELIKYWDFPLYYRAYKFLRPRKRNDQHWWSVALKLFIIADAACEGIGFTPYDRDENTIVGEFWRQRINAIEKHRVSSKQPVKNIETPSSIAPQADPDVVCIQPKSLFPSIGSGSRVFSKNLSILRPRGLVRTQWAVNTHIPGVNQDSGLNILVLPFPYSYEKNEFRIKPIKDENRAETVRVFELNQSWLDEKPFSEFRDTCTKIITNCNDKLKKSVHAIVLPELALNRARFIEFADFAKQLLPSLEFIVSGSSQNCAKIPNQSNGNYIWIRKYVAKSDGLHSASDKYFDVSQSKHHRWQLEYNQILDYGLEHGKDGGLDAQHPHWENFSGRPREVNFFAFREKSAFCGVVCEDLARSEPCHEIIRSVGPNLLFGLLMDGPQIEQRWGAKYASFFAADHGCSVMTISSRALVERSQIKRVKDKNFSTIYFKSPGMSHALPIETKDKDSAVFMRLVPDQNSSARRLINGRTKDVVDWIIDPKFKPIVLKAGKK